MPVYLILSQTPSGQDIRPIVAQDLADLAVQLKATLGTGLSVNNGQREILQVGVVRLNAAGSLTPNADGTLAVVNTVADVQPAIADLPSPTLTTLAQAITAIGTLAAKVNTLLAELRDAGIIAR